jgi:hypothetical protein
MTQNQQVDYEERAFLRHTLATVAYRGGKALRNVPDSFAAFSACEGARTPAQLVAHLGDLYEWALSIVAGKQVWRDSQPLAWEKEVARFFASLKNFDDYLASDSPVHEIPEKLFQGPIADSLTHIGQIAILRRIANCPVKGENYHKAEIVAGRVGAEQAVPRREF